MNNFDNIQIDKTSFSYLDLLSQSDNVPLKVGTATAAAHAVRLEQLNSSGRVLQTILVNSTTQTGPSSSATFIDMGVSATITPKLVASNIFVEASGTFSILGTTNEIAVTVWKSVNGGAYADLETATGNGFAGLQADGIALSCSGVVSFAFLDTASHAITDTLIYQLRARLIVGTSFYNYLRASDIKTMKLTEVAT